MSRGMAFIKSPYGFELFLNPGEVVNLAGVWLCMISIIIRCFTSSNRFLLLEIGPSGSFLVPYPPKVAERGMALGMDLLMEIPGIPLTIFQANGHHAAGVWLLSNPRMAFNVFL